MKVGRWIMRVISTLVIVAVVCVIVAAAVLGRRARASLNESRDNTKSAYTQMNADISDAFTSVEIEAAGDMDVRFALSVDGAAHVSYYDSDKLTHSVRVENGRLVISCTDDRSIASGLGLGDDPYITVSIPDGDYERISVVTGEGGISAGMELDCKSLELTTGKGDISVANVTADALTFATQSGDVTLATATAGSVNITSETGDFSIMNVDAKTANIFTDRGMVECYNVSASDTLECETDTGDVTATGCDGAKISFTSRKGDISVAALATMKLDVQSVSGSVNLPMDEDVTDAESSESSGVCTVRTESGDVEVTRE